MQCCQMRIAENSRFSNSATLQFYKAAIATIWRHFVLNCMSLSKNGLLKLCYTRSSVTNTTAAIWQHFVLNHSSESNNSLFKLCGAIALVSLVIEVTQNWSLECQIDVCWKCKIGARFWLSLGAFCFVKNRCPNGGIRGPISLDSFFFFFFFFPETYFWARFVIILWGLLYYKYRLCIRANLKIEGAETRV